jgi:serine/threonine protein kinase
MRIEIQRQNGETTVQIIEQKEVVLGRVEGADLVLPSVMVSRRHARLVEKDQLLFLVDLGSASGTWLNDRQIRAPVLVKPNDAIRIGDLVLRASLDNAEQGRRIGRYRVLTPLANTHLAEVYLARDEGRLRILRWYRGSETIGPEVEERIAADVRAALSLRHPNLEATLDLDQVEGRLLLVREFVAGVTLTELLRKSWDRERPLTPPALMFAAAQVLEALEAIHATGATHGSVGSDTILIGFDGKPKLLGFGTKVRLPIGCMSPEQVIGRAFGPQSDLFSLGVALWQGLTQKRLFEQETMVQTVEALLKAPVVPPSQAALGLPFVVDPPVVRALERDLAARWTTAAQMRASIAELFELSGARFDERSLKKQVQALFRPRMDQQAAVFSVLKAGAVAPEDVRPAFADAPQVLEAELEWTYFETRT